MLSVRSSRFVYFVANGGIFCTESEQLPCANLHICTNAYETFMHSCGLYEHVFVYWLLKDPFDWYFWFCYTIGQETCQPLPYAPLRRIWHLHRVTGPTFTFRDSSAMSPLLCPTGTLQLGRRSVTFAQTSCSEQQDKMIQRWSVRTQDSPPGRLCVTGNTTELWRLLSLSSGWQDCASLSFSLWYVELCLHGP